MVGMHITVGNESICSFKTPVSKQANAAWYIDGFTHLVVMFVFQVQKE